MKQNLPERVKRMRAFFRPKLPEMKEQCVSCPFRSGNNDEFKVVLDRLAATSGMVPVSQQRVALARAQVRADVAENGEFHCHHSAYDANMNIKPVREHRQCPGATRWFKGLE